MKRRFSSHITLIELTLALFFLMMAMVTILGLFTAAHRMSDRAGKLTQAVQLAQDCAAVIEGSREPEAALLNLGYTCEQPGVLTYNDSSSGLVVVTSNDTKQTTVGYLHEAEIHVQYGGEVIFSIPAVRYSNKEVMGT